MPTANRVGSPPWYSCSIAIAVRRPPRGCPPRRLPRPGSGTARAGCCPRSMPCARGSGPSRSPTAARPAPARPAARLDGRARPPNREFQPLQRPRVAGPQATDGQALRGRRRTGDATAPRSPPRGPAATSPSRWRRRRRRAGSPRQGFSRWFRCLPHIVARPPVATWRDTSSGPASAPSRWSAGTRCPAWGHLRPAERGCEKRRHHIYICSEVRHDAEYHVQSAG